jgi:small subunit ribosomal protein S8
MKEEICALLKREGFIGGYELVEDAKQGQIDITLRYDDTRAPVIQTMRRVSKPSLRVYKKSKDLRPVRSGLGVAIVSTSKGIMTGKEARSENLGGEVLCELW